MPRRRRGDPDSRGCDEGPSWRSAEPVQIANDMATRYGMVETLGHVAREPQRSALLDVPGRAQNGWQPGPETRQRIDEAVRSTVMQAFEQATQLLQDRREVLERCARALLQQETPDADALRTLTSPPVARLPTPEVQASRVRVGGWSHPLPAPVLKKR